MAVVPYYFLVWYNRQYTGCQQDAAVVPYYFLVWYNIRLIIFNLPPAVVPVWYNNTACQVVCKPL